MLFFFLFLLDGDFDIGFVFLTLEDAGGLHACMHELGCMYVCMYEDEECGAGKRG